MKSVPNNRDESGPVDGASLAPTGGKVIVLCVVGTLAWSMLWVAGLAPLVGLGGLPVVGHLIVIAGIPVILDWIWTALSRGSATSESREVPKPSLGLPVKLLPANEEVLIVDLGRPDDLDTDAWWQANDELSSHIRDALYASNTGEIYDSMDAHLIFCTSAEAAFAVVLPILASAPSCFERIQVTLRHGSVAPNTPREIVQLRPECSGSPRSHERTPG